ncbi:PucR family transcriptional regulator [Streptomyces sp. NPDC006879]|uniref:PucR family transcriptional regulator n=1 Tax=Streptomyces sp. NPDC006879 TaxID=3364767 RepID=UPI0036742DFD
MQSPASDPSAPTTPAQPPTTGIPLELLLADRGLGLRLVAGATGVVLHGVHASEMRDPSPYLLGGELLLTAGQELGPGAEGYVARLVTAGVAALGFGVAPVHEAVPPELARACERHALPLLEVAPHTPFTAVARAVWRLMAQERTRELRRVTEAQQALAAAAARPDPVPAVLRRLAATLSGWSALFSPRGEVMHAAGSPPTPRAGDALSQLARRLASGGPATATDSVDSRHLSAYALSPAGPEAMPPSAAPAARLTLGIATGLRSPGDRTIAGVAAVLLTLLTSSRREHTATTAATLLEVLLGGDRERAAGRLGPGPWTVVHARPHESGTGEPAALGAALGAVLLEAGPDRVRLLCEHQPGPQAGWTLGASAPAPAVELTVADTQAARALRRAEAARAPLVRHTGAGLDALIGQEEARAHARALLAPLGPVLVETLRSWLTHHGGWDRTAAALNVHRNTVRQRIARCAALLDRDLDDADVRMELWFALRHGT